MTTICIHGIAACVVVLTLSGCSGGEGPIGQHTPEATIHKMDVALLEGDCESYVECFLDEGGRWQGALEASFEMHQIGWEFRDRLIAAYGEDAYDVLAAMGEESVVIDIPPREQEDLWQCEIRRVAPGRVVVDGTHYRNEMHLVEKNGVWYADPRSAFGGSPLTPESLQRLMQAINEAHSVVMAKVGKPGYDLDRIYDLLRTEGEQRMGRALRGE